jgi:predicted nucleic acid-binding Zn ribbon protein
MKEDNIWNTICPVCGSPIPNDMPLVELAHVSEGHHHQDEAQRGIRLCSQECAEAAERSPANYRAAAAANRVVDDHDPNLESRP